MIEKQPDTLRAAAQAVVERWDTPLWKDVPATAEYIGRLRSALAAQAPQPGYVLVPVEPTHKMLNDAVKAFNEATASLGAYSAPEAAYRAMLAAAPKAPQQEVQELDNYRQKWDAELGRTALLFVDRAGDVHPGIDDAETICADFYKAMSAVIEQMPHVQNMCGSPQKPEKALDVWGKVHFEQVADGIEVGYDLFGGVDIRLGGEFVYVHINYDWRYTDNATRKRLADQIVGLLTAQPAPSGDAAIEEVIQDANRYRWLRRPLLHAGQGSIVVTMDDRANGKIDRVIYLEALDAAIDAARKEGK